MCPNKSEGADAVLEVTWINPTRGIKPVHAVLKIPVTPGARISEYLEDMYMETAKLSNIEISTFEPEFVQLLRNDSLLTSDEYNTSVDFFTGEKVKLGLNTLHCGTLIVRVTDLDPGGLPRPLCVLELDFGDDTLETMVQIISKRTGNISEYIYTENRFLVHPGMTQQELEKIPVKGQIQQFQEIRVKDKIENEIGVIVQIQWESNIVSFIDKSMTIQKLKETLEPISGILAVEQNLIVDGNEIDDEAEALLNLKDGSVIVVYEIDYGALRIAARCTIEDRFADMTGEIENIPKGAKKYEKPSAGLNLQGHCVNEECKISKEKIKLLILWPHSTFDLITESKEVRCPECLTAINVQSPLFHLTQWKFYGRKSEPNTEVENNAGSDKTSTSKNLLSCEWQISDDPDSSSGFNVVDLPGMQVGLADWEALAILTQPLPKKKARMPILDFLKFGFGISFPGMFSINWDFNRFKAFD